LNIKKVNFILGLGTGITISSFVFFIAYSFTLNSNQSYNANLQYNIEEEILQEDITSEIERLLSDREAATYTQTEEENPEYVFIQIPVGFAAINIAQILFEQGLIGDIESFTQYLIYRGITQSIFAGEFYISSDATYEEIADIIQIQGM
jgi:cell division protein YceG involved in septum cleavage